MKYTDGVDNRIGKKNKSRASADRNSAECSSAGTGNNDNNSAAEKTEADNLAEKKVKRMLEILDELYPEPKCSLTYETPVQMLIATQLSAQCTDNCVNNVTKTLFKKYRTVQEDS